jgi:FAD/FMN-containing dehydrogenase
MVGSLGTLAVIVQATLRCRPRPAAAAWTTVAAEPDVVRSRALAPSMLLWDGAATHARFEGDPLDVEAQVVAAGGIATARPPELPGGAFRGRISVRAGEIVPLGRVLDGIAGCRWLAEGGIGTVHVATDTLPALVGARAAAQAVGGWLLREAGGADSFNGFGADIPERGVARRLKAAFDPTGKLSPGRIPL